MLKKLMKKEEGFTLAELLIVVAIIAVLVAVSIPIFMGQLEKSRLATNRANARAAKAALVAAYLDDDTIQSGEYEVASGVFKGDTASSTGTITTEPIDWTVNTTVSGSDTFGKTVYDGKWKVYMGSDGKVSYTPAKKSS